MISVTMSARWRKADAIGGVTSLDLRVFCSPLDLAVVQLKLFFLLHHLLIAHFRAQFAAKGVSIDIVSNTISIAVS